MTKKILFQDSFLLSGIMCFKGCGALIQHCFDDCLQQCKKDALLPEDAQLVMDAEPQALGVHRLFITITHNGKKIILTESVQKKISTRFKESVSSMYDVINNIEEDKKDAHRTNWINIIINLLAIGAISALSLIFSPSLLLTLGLTLTSFLTTAFTARNYLFGFIQNLRSKNLFNMHTTVTLGWLLSLVHTLYHTISMPLLSGFPMVFMCFIMPVSLIALINGMDEIKQRILSQSKKMHLKGMKMLFPQMADKYSCYQLSPQEQELLSHPIDTILYSLLPADVFLQRVESIVKNNKKTSEQKSALKEGMIISVKRGECFPVDCNLLYGQTIVDASLLTGEPQQIKKLLDFIPAGAINLGEEVVVRASKDPYHSTINQLLFRSNRAKENITVKPNYKFTYIYSSLIFLGIAAAIVAPFALGILTFSLALQNITGILFALCPCTMAIAHELPNLLNIYQRSNNGITIRDENLCAQTHPMHTIVFDKTGTLTTGNSQVESSEGMSVALWQRVYLLEKHYGAEHPLAKAITHYYERKTNHRAVIQDIQNVANDPNNRGLSGIVQGRKIHVGSADYLRRAGITVPELNPYKAELGFTPVYVAEDNAYRGVIYIKHEIRKDALAALTRLKQEGKRIVMLTGDSASSALGFNQQNGSIFEIEDIHAEKSPQDKENILSKLVSTKDVDPKGVWFIGDGLNDAPCAKTVTEKGGVSCAMTSDDKTSFFTDISLNGSLNYLFEHNKLNNFLQKNILQNRGLLMYSAVAFIAFILSFSIAGIAVSPIIPLMVMASTTLMVLFNSYRVQLNTDCALNPNSSWLKQLLASDASITLLTGASFLFMCGLLISTIATGGLAFPIFTFTAGAAAAISSLCILTASLLCVVFTAMTATYFFFDKYLTAEQEINSPAPSPLDAAYTVSPERPPEQEKKSRPSSLWNLDTPRKEEEQFELPGPGSRIGAVY